MFSRFWAGIVIIEDGPLAWVLTLLLLVAVGFGVWYLVHGIYQVCEDSGFGVHSNTHALERWSAGSRMCGSAKECQQKLQPTASTSTSPRRRRGGIWDILEVHPTMMV